MKTASLTLGVGDCGVFWWSLIGIAALRKSPMRGLSLLLIGIVAAFGIHTFSIAMMMLVRSGGLKDLLIPAQIVVWIGYGGLAMHLALHALAPTSSDRDAIST